ncbi:hypothetical protein O181_071901 [Austropuccinia psidii MF-1]|uniref:Uncharacterized protein n=1 Tax=Austropuccinia psidii MF-1 TaxID=1389203 RepID=A0A9Q3F1K9_9BASI|nr:hypothetical protein [Austropuccinia psidii MF-1]
MDHQANERVIYLSKLGTLRSRNPKTMLFPKLFFISLLIHSYQAPGSGECPACKFSTAASGQTKTFSCVAQLKCTDETCTKNLGICGEDYESEYDICQDEKCKFEIPKEIYCDKTHSMQHGEH